ncbi:MAG: hypothetical protein Q4D98_02675 [Planctomycetia bacterium]|nr:hypothetical protein [Planctomycetia bacterium]
MLNTATNPGLLLVLLLLASLPRVRGGTRYDRERLRLPPPGTTGNDYGCRRLLHHREAVAFASGLPAPGAGRHTTAAAGCYITGRQSLSLLASLIPSHFQPSGRNPFEKEVPPQTPPPKTFYYGYKGLLS